MNIFFDDGFFDRSEPDRDLPRRYNQPETYSVDSVLVVFEDRPLTDPPPENTTGDDE